MESKNEKVRVIWHGEWSDSEIAVRVSKNRVNLYNYRDVEELLDTELFPNGFSDVEESDFEDEVLNIVENLELEPSEKVWLNRYTWEWHARKDQNTYGYCSGLSYQESDEDKVLRTTSEALRDALDEIIYAGYLYIYDGDCRIVFCASVVDGTIIRQY